MKDKEIQNTLASVVNALNTIEVKGINNLTCLVGSINTLRELMIQLEGTRPSEG